MNFTLLHMGLPQPYLKFRYNFINILKSIHSTNVSRYVLTLRNIYFTVYLRLTLTEVKGKRISYSLWSQVRKQSSGT
jgi:hypothetical protein